jgi:hypothetical protein
MDARAVLHPVGPHEPGVYWTRRAFLLLAIVVVLVLFTVYACSGGSNRPAATGRGTTPTGTPTPTSPSTTPAAVTTCRPGEVTVAASTDAATYPAGVLPRLIATIRTTGTSACTVPVSAISWAIVSGPDPVFTTAGCPKAAKTVLTVRPNHPARSGLLWNRHRSVAGCATPGPAAGPGTYQVRATVAGVRSAAAVFHLTG